MEPVINPLRNPFIGFSGIGGRAKSRYFWKNGLITKNGTLFDLFLLINLSFLINKKGQGV